MDRFASVIYLDFGAITINAVLHLNIAAEKAAVQQQVTRLRVAHRSH